MAPASTHRIPGREVTVMGLETEYGILGAEPEDVVAACLEAEGEAGRSRGVRWDYSGEYPLRDARGFEMDRAAADPSMLTDIPGAASVEAPVPGRVRTTAVVRLTAQEEAWQRGTATCVGTGGRLYVDHGHPEYATPECTGAAQAVLADRAGDLLVASGAERLRRRGVKARLFKNNVDGKGATYGTHENYLVPRALDFDDLVQALVPLLVVRPLLVGSGRVGTGAIGQGADFQISQRADYLEKVVGLGTTVDRPLVNTRDEPHADPQRWRRLHLVAGDANCFDTIGWLKLGMTSLVLQVLADGVPAADLRDRLGAPLARAASRLLGITDTPSHLPAASPDYWEVAETVLTLGTAAPVLLGLEAATALARAGIDLGGPAHALAERAAAVRSAMERNFAPAWGRHLQRDDVDAAIALVLPPFTRPLAGARTVRQTAAARMHRPTGGLAPGAGWRDDGISWTPETALMAWSALALGMEEEGTRLLAWLEAHRTAAGALPEKVLADGAPAGPAPLAWTCALILLATASRAEAPPS